MLNPATPFASVFGYVAPPVIPEDPEDPEDPPDPPGPDLRVRVVTNGAVFNPFFRLTVGGAILTEFSDETTSNETTYAKDFGSVAERTQYVTATPSTSLEQINFGYDGGDGGDRYFPYADHRDPTNVLEVTNVAVGAPRLRYFAANNSPIETIDLSGCAFLEACECYYAHYASSANLEGCTALKRVCFETGNLSSLDVSDAIAIEDVRGRGQGIHAAPGQARDFRVTLGDCSALWHLCLGSQGNGHVLGVEALATGQVALPALEQWWLFDGHPAVLTDGVYSYFPLTLNVPNPTLQSIWASGCNHTSFSSANVRWNPEANTELLLSGNPLQSIDLTGCEDIHVVDLSNCNLTQAQVDYALGIFASGTYENGTLNLGGNAAPSVDGLALVDVLRARGYTVTHAS